MSEKADFTIFSKAEAAGAPDASKVSLTGGSGQLQRQQGTPESANVGGNDETEENIGKSVDLDKEDEEEQEQAKEKEEHRPWRSINDMLKRNRCWLCKKIFPRGHQKLVFQVSDLIWFFNDRMIEEKTAVDAGAEKEGGAASDGVGVVTSADATSGAATMKAMNSRNLRDCFESYKQLLASNTLQQSFKEDDVQMWMSGLVCALSDTCRSDAALFIDMSAKGGPGGAGNFTTADATAKSDRNQAMFLASTGADGCPPGCGCDNPWAFLA